MTVNSNWIVCLTRNNIELTKRAVASFRAQDVGSIKILILDNHSSDGTHHWLNREQLKGDLHVVYNWPQRSVAASWNTALRWLFERRWATGNALMLPQAEYALVCNNDVILHPSTYRFLIEDGGQFVTAVGTRDERKLDNVEIPDPAKKRPHPDFSCYLIRRETWQKVGQFDEEFKIAYVEDQDYHLRMHRAGVRAEALELPFLHLGAQTVSNANGEEKRRIMDQADRNREYFKTKYGFAGGSEEYYQQFGHGAPPEPDSRI